MHAWVFFYLTMFSVRSYFGKDRGRAVRGVMLQGLEQIWPGQEIGVFRNLMLAIM